CRGVLDRHRTRFGSLHGLHARLDAVVGNGGHVLHRGDRVLIVTDRATVGEDPQVQIAGEWNYGRPGSTSYRVGRATPVPEGAHDVSEADKGTRLPHLVRPQRS